MFYILATGGTPVDGAAGALIDDMLLHWFLVSFFLFFFQLHLFCFSFSLSICVNHFIHTTLCSTRYEYTYLMLNQRPKFFLFQYRECVILFQQYKEATNWLPSVHTGDDIRVSYDDSQSFKKAYLSSGISFTLFSFAAWGIFFFLNYFSLCERSVVNDRQERAEVLQQSPTVPTQTQPAASQPQAIWLSFQLVSWTSHQ